MCAKAYLRLLMVAGMQTGNASGNYSPISYAMETTA